tara:strand:- start:84 stop:323 length:240 start_codon:yes stop_codon:yes gene_type:complete
MEKFSLEILLRNVEGSRQKQLIIPTTYAETFSDRVEFYGENGHEEIVLVGEDWKYAGQVYDFLLVYPRDTCLPQKEGAA